MGSNRPNWSLSRIRLGISRPYLGSIEVPKGSHLVQKTRAKRPPQPPGKNPPTRVKVRVTRQSYSLLTRLREQGLFGRTETEVATRLLDESLLNVLRKLPPTPGAPGNAEDERLLDAADPGRPNKGSR